MKSNAPQTKKLSLKRERIRPLSRAELSFVIGGDGRGDAANWDAKRDPSHLTRAVRRGCENPSPTI